MISYTTQVKPGCAVVRQYPASIWNFPSGEVGIRINDAQHGHTVETAIIYAALRSSDEVMQLLMITDAIRRQYPNAKVSLVLGYTPYGRQDRVCNVGESLSIKVFADLINSQDYHQATLIDPHSYVSEALFNKCEVFTQEQVFGRCFSPHIPLVHRDLIVAPDAGAAKKAQSIAEKHNFSDVLYASKTRDMETGNITKYEISGDVKGRQVVVVDDLVDGGATFLLLGKKLREAGAAKLTLCITHGIFTKGTERLAEMYDELYTTNTYHADRVGLIDGVNYIKLM